MAIGEELFREEELNDFQRALLNRIYTAHQEKNPEAGIENLYGFMQSKTNFNEEEFDDNIKKLQDPKKSNPKESFLYIERLLDQIKFTDEKFGGQYFKKIESGLEKNLVSSNKEDKNYGLRTAQYYMIKKYLFGEKVSDKENEQIKKYTIEKIKEYLKKEGKNGIKDYEKILNDTWDEGMESILAPAYLMDSEAYKAIISTIDKELGGLKDYVKRLGYLNYLKAKAQNQ